MFFKKLLIIPCLLVAVTAQSRGCDNCINPLQPGSDYTCRFSHDGHRRTYLLYAPDTYNSSQSTPLIVDLHGFTENERQHAGLDPWENYSAGLGSGFRLVADREGFIVATPKGRLTLWAENDVSFIEAVVERIKAIANIDPDNIYITGISRGGVFSYIDGCDLSQDIFRGIAPVAAKMEDPDSCDEIFRPTPLIAFHSKNDRTMPYQEGYSAARHWAELNNCEPEPAASMVLGGPYGYPGEFCYAQNQTSFELTSCETSSEPTTCITWDGCDDGVEVTFCTVPGDPANEHALYWNQTQLSIAAVSWDFFSRF